MVRHVAEVPFCVRGGQRVAATASVCRDRPRGPGSGVEALGRLESRRKRVTAHTVGVVQKLRIDRLPVISVRSNGDRLVGYRMPRATTDLHDAGTPPVGGLAKRPVPSARLGAKSNR